MSCHDRVVDTLQEHGMRLTAQRALILEDLFHEPGHRTAEAIYQSVSGRLPALNRATVYRTLETLREARLVAAYEGPEGVTVFEAVRAETEHHHLTCRVCGEQTALECEPVDRLREEIRARYGFAADLDHLVLIGVCAHCAAEGK